jgi:NADPH-dependent 2,4-dienoyl-CoA reductase/sulfur reductase-like enzyme
MTSERIVIVGAGPAGVRAAEVLLAAGLRPTVLDEAPASGGQIYRQPPPELRRAYSELYGFEAPKAKRLHDAFEHLRDAVDYRPGRMVWNLQRNHLHILHAGDGETVPFDHLILATGAMDRVLPFDGWTLPGVFTLGGAQVALKSQACAVGRRTVFFGSSPLLPYIAYQYAKAGAKVVAVLDTAPRTAKLRALPGLLVGGATFIKGAYYLAWLRAHSIAYEHGVTPVGALGDQAVEGLRYTDARGRERSLDCDAIAFGYGLKSELQLADLAGCDLRFDPVSCNWILALDENGRTSVPGIYAAGDGAAIRGADAAELSGARAAHTLLGDLGLGGQNAELRRINRRLGRIDNLRTALETAFPFPRHLAQSIPDSCVVCRCEVITAGEIRQAVQGLGADDINRAKAFCRVGMGRCQGRVCESAAAEIVAAALGRDLAAVGRFRAQAPVKPVPIAALAQREQEDLAS